MENTYSERYSLVVKRISLILLIFLASLPTALYSQDTVRISLAEFIQRGLEQSAQLDLEEKQIDLGYNEVDQIRSRKILPRFEVTTNHGVLPVAEFSDPNQDVDIDWGNASIFTQVNFQMVQPLFTWGALNSGIDAAKNLAKSREAAYQSKKMDEEKQLFELYQGRILVSHLEALMREAEEILQDAKKRFEEMDPAEISYKDEYELKLFEKDFEIQKAELNQQKRFLEDVWVLVLGEDYKDKVVLPASDQITDLQEPNQKLIGLMQHARQYAPKVMQAKSLYQAARSGLEAQKKSFIPMMYLGLGGEYVRTPIPVAQQPLIGGRNSYANIIYSFGFRFNLNFAKMNADIDKSRIQMGRAQDAIKAADQLTFLKVREAYKELNIARSKVDQTREALDLANEWLRQEQVDYDLEIGTLEHLVDAVKKSMEYKVKLAEHMHNFNSKLSVLYTSSGYSLKELSFK